MRTQILFISTGSHNMQNLIPKPISVTPAPGAFVLSSTTKIKVGSGDSELLRLGSVLANALRPATGFPLPVSQGPASDSSIILMLDSTRPLGDEGYALTISPTFLTLAANHPAGIFYGIQTLRQLLPAAIDGTTPQAGPWEIA